MRISLARGISSSLYRIFFVSLCFGDCLSFNRLLFLPFAPYTAYARVAKLCVKRRAEQKRASNNC